MTEGEEGDEEELKEKVEVVEQPLMCLKGGNKQPKQK